MAEQTGRPYAVFDIDGTLIRWQLYHAIADQMIELGYINPDDFTTIKDARMTWKRREHGESFHDYELKLVNLYKRILADLSFSHFCEAADAVFDEYKDQAYTYTRDLIKKLKSEGYLLFAISGSQTEIVEKIASYYGFDDFVGSTFVHKNDQFTGEINSPFSKKREILQSMIKKHKVTTKGSLAIGDSAGDISMLDVAEHAIAFNPEKKLFDHAKSQGWKIVVERKNMVYEMEYKDGKYVLAKTN